MNTTLQELADLTGGEIISGDPSLLITGFNSIQEAESGDVTFLGNSRYAPALKKSRASAVLTEEAGEGLPAEMAVIRVSNPTLQFGTIIQKYGPQKLEFVPGIHPSACIHPNATVNPATVFVGANAVIDDGAVVGDGSAIHANAYIGVFAKVGNDCIIYPNVVLKERCTLGNRVILNSGAVIGSDGFGYEFSGGKHVKIDQVGIVQIDDDVEIGSCTTIDRARFGRTVIGEGTKVDNQVQIAHNVTTGKHCVIVSQVGIAGSARLGNYVTVAAQAGIAGHLTIGNQTILLGRSGVTKDVPDKGVVTGFPARPLMEGRRLLAAPSKVPDILARLKAMEKRVKELEQKLTENQ